MKSLGWDPNPIWLMSLQKGEFGHTQRENTMRRWRRSWGWCFYKPRNAKNYWKTTRSKRRGTDFVAQMVKKLHEMQETRVQSLDWEDPLEKEMAIYSSILAWRVPWTEEPGMVQSAKSQTRLSNFYSLSQIFFRALRKNQPIDTLMSDFKPPELWDHKLLLFKQLSLWYFFTEILANEYTQGPLSELSERSTVS